LLHDVKTDTAQSPGDSFSASSYVYKALKVWADTISSLHLRVVDVEGAELKNHRLASFLMTMNPDRPTSELWRQWSNNIGLWGEAGFEVVFDRKGNPAEMWPHNPDTFFVQKPRGGRNEVLGRPVGYSICVPAVAEYKLSLDSFCHWKFYDPKNIWRGIAPLRAVRMQVMIDQLSSAWQYHFFKNQARPDFVVYGPQGVSPRERDAMYDKFTQRFGINDDAETWGVGNFLILEQGVHEVKTLTFPPRDMAWADLRKFNRAEVASTFGVPEEIMGYERATYENWDRAEQVLWTVTLLPLLEFRDDKLTHFFRQRGLMNEMEFIRTDLSRVWALRRVLDPVFRQAIQFFSMGVPYRLIDEHFGFGMPRFAGDDISNPFGTNVSIGSGGEVISSGSTSTEVFPEDASSEETGKIFSDIFGTVRFKHRRNGRFHYAGND
jgi:HK97 family phage portal protein